MTHAKPSKETLARIRHAEEEATRTFGTTELAKQWMAKNNFALGCSPVAMLASEDGLMEVRRILSAIAYGGAA